MDNLYKKALFLGYFTVVYNIIEAFCSILFGRIANSIALIGFGLDSIMESLSGIIMIWRFSYHKKISDNQEKIIENSGTKFVAFTFFILGFYVLFQSIKKIIIKEIPDTSLPGIIIAIASIIVMPILAWQKYKTGKQIRSKALIADSKETIVCSFLSLSLLIGLVFNYLYGLWYADPFVGLIIVVYLFNEGKEILKEVNLT